MKNFRISVRLRLARMKTKKTLKKHPYIYGIVFLIFVFAVTFGFPSRANHSNTQDATNSLVQYKTGSIADLDAARSKAANEGKELKVIDLTKKAPAILDQTPVK